MLEILPHTPSHFVFFFFKKTAGNLKNITVFFRFPPMFSNRQLPDRPKLFKIPIQIIRKISGTLFLLIRHQRLHTKHFPIFRTYDIYHTCQRAESLFAVRYSVIPKTTLVDSSQHYGNVPLRVSPILDSRRRTRIQPPEPTDRLIFFLVEQFD